MTETAERSDAKADAKPKRELGKQVMAPDSIPEGIKAAVLDKLGADARATPAREGGGYKGKVIYANDRYLVQAVGQKQENAVVHRKGDVEFVGQKLGWREQNNLLNGVNVQVHYSGDKAKAYVWNQEREQAARVAGPAAGPSKAVGQARGVEMAERARNPDSEATQAAKGARKAVEAAEMATGRPVGGTSKAKPAEKAPERAEKAAEPKAKAASPKPRRALKTPEKAAAVHER